MAKPTKKPAAGPPGQPGPSAEKPREKVQRLLAEGKHADLAEACERALELEPRSPELHKTLVLALTRLGRWDRAARAMGRWCEIQSPRSRMRQDHALLLLAAGQTGEALFLVKDEKSEAPDGHLLRALMAFWRAQPGVAFGHLLEARRSGGSGPALDLLRGLAEARLGWDEAALRSLQSPAVLELQRPEPLVLAGNLLAAQGRQDAAAELWLQAAERAEPGSALAKRLAPLRSRRPGPGAQLSDEKLLAHLQSSPQLDADGSLRKRLRLALAVGLARAGKAAAALPELEDLARNEKSGPLALLFRQNLAMAYETLGRGDQAVLWWGRLLELLAPDDPRRPLIHFHRCELLLAAGKAKQAGTELKAALRHAPAPSKLVLQVIGAVHETGDCHSGSELYRKALERASQDLELLASAAEYAEHHDEEEEARALWGRVLALKPDHAKARAARLQALRSQFMDRHLDGGRHRGKPADRRQLLDQILALDPADPMALAHSARVSVEEKDLERAHRQWQEALWSAAGQGAPVLTAILKEADKNGASGELKLFVARLQSSADIPRLLSLGAAVLKNGQTATAMPVLRLALEAGGSPDEERWVLVLRSLLDAGQAEIAQQLAKEALQAASDSPRLLFLLSAAMERGGNRVQAKKLDADAFKLAQRRGDAAALKLRDELRGPRVPKGLPEQNLLGFLEEMYEQALEIGFDPFKDFGRRGGGRRKKKK